MKIVLFIVLGVLGVILLMTAVGALLPRRHIASRSARFQATPDALWQTLTDFARLPEWAPEMTKVERVADLNGHPVWMHVGRRWSAPMEVTEFAPTRRFTMRIADPKLPFGGTWTYDLAVIGGGTMVTITEKGEIGNPLMRFMSRFLFSQTSTMDGYLKGLGSRFGETVTPAPGVPAS